MATTPTAGALIPDTAARLSTIAMAAKSDPARATKLAAEAKSDGITSPLVHHLLALELKDAGRFEEAIAELGLGLALAPHDARLITTTGFCLLELGRRQEAARVFETAIKIDPLSVEATYGYGCAAERLGALESSESAFRRTLSLDPNHANAMAGISGLAVRRRDWETAREYAERAVGIDGRQTDARTNLARVEIGLGDFAAAERRLSDIIGLPHLVPQARADAHIMRGNALDGAHRYRDAFDAYATGKAELRNLYAPELGRSDRKTATEVVREILAEFLDMPGESWAPAKTATARGAERGHAFLLGFARSGTTLLEQILATHPNATVLGERPLMLDAEIEFLTSSGGVRRLASVMSDLLEPYRQSYWKRAQQFGANPAGKVFVDKQPLSTLRLPLINKVFPRAKIIFLMRDPRDVVVSCFRRNFNMNASTYEFTTIESAASHYVAVMEAGEVYFERLNLDLHRLRYEDLVADFDQVSRGLCDFLELEWTAGLRDFAGHAHARSIATPSSTQVGRGLYEEGAGQWRNYAFALERVMPILEPWITKFGYPPA